MPEQLRAAVANPRPFGYVLCMAKASKGDRADARASKRAQIQGARPGPTLPASSAAPFLMAPPGPDATRRFTLLADTPRGPTVVELYFCVPEGLWRLQGQPTTAGTYRAWAAEMQRQRTDAGLPERVPVPEALRLRKLWEAGRALRLGHSGAEVDLALAAALPLRAPEPPHPALGLDLATAKALPAAALAARPHRVAPFQHTLPEAELREAVRRFGATAGIAASTADPEAGLSMLAEQVRDWARQWGLDEIRELCCDAAIWHSVTGDRDAARTFLDLARAAGPEGERAVVAFLTDFVRHHFR